MVWIESPSNPGLDVLAIRELADAAHAGGATVVVDNTLASPLRQRPLDLGADVSVTSASKHLSGHSDVVLGVVAVREAERADALRTWRGTTGAIPGPFETWLAHRSLATLAVRLERQEANARAIAARAARARRRQRRRAGPRSARSCASTRAARRAPTRCSPRARSSRRPRASAACTPTPSAGRAGAPTRSSEGDIRLNAGIEAAADLVADLERALSLSRT